MLNRLLSHLQADTWSLLGVPLVTLFLGGVTIWLLTALVHSWCLHRHESASHAEVHSRQTLSSWNRFFLTEGRLVAASVLWMRWFAFAALFLYSAVLIADNLYDSISDLDDSRFRQTLHLLERFSDTLRTWGKIGLRAFVLIVGAIWLTKFIENTAELIVDRYVLASGNVRGKLRSQTLNSASSYAIRAAMFVVLFLSVLQLVGLNIAPLLATAGVASIAIGFGAQTLVKDVLAGFFILLEDQFAVGDVISIDGKSGRVENMTLRVTRLRNGNGELLVIPNGEIRTLSNKTSGWSQIDLQINVAYSVEIEFALSVLREELDLLWAEFDGSVVEKPLLVGVDKLLDSSVVLRGFIKTIPDKKWEVERAINKRVLNRFKNENISLPFPQREVWLHNVTSKV